MNPYSARAAIYPSKALDSLLPYHSQLESARDNSFEDIQLLLIILMPRLRLWVS